MNKGKILAQAGRVLYIKESTIYAQIGNYLCSSMDFGETWSNLAVKLPYQTVVYCKLLARLTRKDIHSMLFLDDEKTITVTGNVIFTFSIKKGNIINLFKVPRGSRPLFLCQTQEGFLYWGEYFRNPKRVEVNIYASFDKAKSWQIIYKFKKNQIRHIHGVFCDPYDNKIWVTTGDSDEESAIWMTANKFKTLEKVIYGSQQSRALQLTFTQDYVYFGTDTPFEQNHIFRINKNTGNIEEIFSVDGSVYWWCKAGDWLFFSTAVEQSQVNICKYAELWGSPDSLNWQCIAKFKKDFWPMKYFQIGQILFPQGENRTGYLFYTPFATEGDQTLQRLKITDLA